MWYYLFEDITHNGFTISVILVSLMLSLIALHAINRKKDRVKKRLSLIYTHLFFLFFPLIFISSMWSCDMSILRCMQKKILWIIPLSILTTFAVGFFVIPYLYRIIHRSKEVIDAPLLSFVKEYSKILGIRGIPKVYFVDSSKPMAHSFTNFKPSIFISVGMFEMLKKKELQAVILHELHHIMTRSSFLKFSTQFARFVSPLARFTILDDELNDEECNADSFAVKMQKTDRFLLLAKQKIMHYSSTIKMSGSDIHNSL